MVSIFYDFETTDALFLGQILNYSFIAVDDRWNIISELSGLIKISRLQLPAPRAILTNKVDVLRHQEEASDSELVAARKIVNFLQTIHSDSDGQAKLIGFNSSKFDLQYLRTTLTRNGINPYLGDSKSNKKLANADLLVVARKLVTVDPKFAKITITSTPEGPKRKLTLENLTKAFGIIEGPQTHYSRDDVLLTIKLAKYISESFGIDVRSYSPYEGREFHRNVRSSDVVFLRSPQYDLTFEGDYVEFPATLLDYSGTSSLWIDLARYKKGEGRASIVWKNTNEGGLFLSPDPPRCTTETFSLARQAQKEFAHVSSKNFFARTSCDIEQDIYRLDFNDRDNLILKMHGGSEAQPLSKDAKVILARYKLRNYSTASGPDLKFMESFRGYIRYRYGGNALVNKFADAKSHSPEDLHPKFSSYVADLGSFLAEACESDKALLMSLRDFYKQSEILAAVPEMAF